MPRKTPPSPPTVSATVKKQIGQAARKPNAAAIVASLSRQSLTPAVHNRKVSPEMIELILVRVAAGATVRAVCLEFGIASGTIYQRAIDDQEFRVRLHAAQEQCGKALFDMMVEVAWNENESTERSKLKIQVLDRLARTFDRSLSDRQQIDVRTQTVYVLPPGSDDF